MNAAGLSSGFPDLLEELLREIHRELIRLGDSYEECQGMGATLSLCWFTPEWMYFGHIGDSRIYYTPKSGQMKQLTKDDTHLGWLYRAGSLTEREARNHPRRNALQQSLEASNQCIDPQIGAVGLEGGDRFDYGLPLIASRYSPTSTCTASSAVTWSLVDGAQASKNSPQFILVHFSNRDELTAKKFLEKFTIGRWDFRNDRLERWNIVI